MRIIGLDPGYALCGYGIIDHQGHQLRAVACGAFSTPAGMSFEKRLLLIYDGLCEILDKYQPDVMAIEELFFAKNTTTAMGTAQARGVLTLAAAQRGMPLFEYKPMQVKKAVTGYGGAKKQQVQEMVRVLLGLKEIVKPDDAADALAVAICQAHTGLLGDYRLRGGYQ